jgi:adenylate cyclase
MKPGNFFAELKRRNVYKVAITYAVVAWLLVQAASILLPTFEAPTWVMKAFVVFLAFGFVISVMISWAFEATPEGLKRTENVPPDAVLPTWSPRKFATFIVAVAVIAAGLLAFNLFRTVGTDRRAVRAVDAEKEGRRSAASLPISRKSIAVLPLLNESGDPKDE